MRYQGLRGWAWRGQRRAMGQNLDELFDVVDEHDRVTGQMVRREVHRLGLRHRAVHLFVVNRAGQVFLQQRSMKKDLFPGYWNTSAAGHVGAGEDYDGTAVRELEEELGWKLPPDAMVRGVGLLRQGSETQGAPRPQMEPLFKVEAREETGQEFVWVYRVDAEGPFVLQADEVERGDWFTPEEIERWLAERPHEIAPALHFLWPRARPHLR